jgi:anti-anti-sigma factor
MLTEAPSGWSFAIDRGPDWLFVRVVGPDDGDSNANHLGETIWQFMQQQFARRVVLDLSGLRLLRSVVVGQLVQLHKRVYTHGGLMRLAGLSDANYDVLVACRLHERFPHYRTPTDAVMGYRPEQPR